MLGSAGRIGRWRRRPRAASAKTAATARAATSRSRAQPAHDRQSNRGRDRRLAVRRAGRRTGAASRSGAAAIAEFPADRRHHRPVPHHRPPLGRTPQAANLPPKPAFARCSRTSAMCCRTRRPSLTEGDPAQYALAKLRLPEAHTLGPRRQCDDCRDRFRNRRQASGICRIDRGLLRCARQQGRSACPRHRRGRRDRRACAADGQRAGGEDPGDPRFRRGAERRGKHFVRDPEGASTMPRRMAPRSSI